MSNNILYKQAQIISGFPGVGKSYCTEHLFGVLDSDSSKFSWLPENVSERNPDFPDNYMKHIEESRYKTNLIMVSSHKEVRDALVETELFFTLVYPEHNCKETYIKNYKDRGSPDGFIKLIDANWSLWLKELQEQEGCAHIVLRKNQYLYNILGVEA